MIDDKFFSPSEEHIFGQIWPECDCMDCASTFETIRTEKILNQDWDLNYD